MTSRPARILAAMASLLALLPALLPGGLQAQTPVTYSDGGRALFHIEAPDFWTMRTGGPRLLTAPDSDETRPTSRIIGLQPTAADDVWVGFVSPHGVATLEQAEDYLRDIGPHLVNDARTTARGPVRIGGRPAMRYTGSGRRNGRAVSFTAVTIDLPGPRVAVSVTVIEAGADPVWTGYINAIYASFRVAQ